MEKHISAGCFLLRKAKNKNYELLVIHRKWGNGQEAYVLPKGHLENNETLEEAARRETIEETGYTDFDIVKYLGSYGYSLKINDGIEKTDSFFLAILNSDQRKEQDLTKGEKESGFEISWKGLKEGIDLLTWENQSKFTEQIFQYID